MDSPALNGISLHKTRNSSRISAGSLASSVNPEGHSVKRPQWVRGAVLLAALAALWLADQSVFHLSDQVRAWSEGLQPAAGLWALSGGMLIYAVLLSLPFVPGIELGLALVLCVDEKSQIQALDRTQPGLPLKKGRCGTMTHDYKRNGTTTLFAALNLADGRVIGSCMPRHRHQEWLAFLRQVDRQTPSGLDLHLILDNYQTHKHPMVKQWLENHPRFHMHFIPTSSSWLNLVERVFGDLTVKCIRRGAFRSVAQLIEAIEGFLEHRNKNPKPLVWTASAKTILAKAARAREVLHNEC